MLRFFLQKKFKRLAALMVGFCIVFSVSQVMAVGGAGRIFVYNATALSLEVKVSEKKILVAGTSGSKQAGLNKKKVAFRTFKDLEILNLDINFLGINSTYSAKLEIPKSCRRLSKDIFIYIIGLDKVYLNCY